MDSVNTEAIEQMCTRQSGEICSKFVDSRCIAYNDPYVWYRRGGCPLCNIPSDKVASEKKKVNALKASRRKARGR